MRWPELNRRDFLRVLAGGGAALTLSAAGCGGKSSPRVTLGPGGLLVDGQSVPLFGGAVDYWNHSPDDWDSLLERLLRLGINTVSVSVPWEVHELSPGNYEFGQSDPVRNVAGFIAMAGGKGFHVLLRPGVLQHMPGGCGVPERVLYDPVVQARCAGDSAVLRHTADGQYPAPSLYSRALLHELGPWFDQLAFNLNPLLHGAGGPVVALLFESALSFFTALDRPYSLDYHPDCLASFRAWLENRHQDIEKLNRGYGTAYQSFGQVEPPREFLAEQLDNLPAYLDWVEFRRWGDNQCLDTVVSMLAERGLNGVPVVRKAPLPGMLDNRDQDGERVEIFDSLSSAPVVATNAYAFKSAARRANGAGDYSYRSGLAGGVAFPAREGIGLAMDYEFAMMLSLMYGLKGWESGALVESDGILAAPVQADGRVRDAWYNAYRRVCRFVLESHLDQFTRRAETVFLGSRPLEALINAATENRVQGDLLETDAAYNRLVDFGLETPVQACRTWAGQMESLLSDVGFDWDYAIPGLESSRMARYKVAILPVTDFVFAAEIVALDRFVRSGGVLIYGPGQPSLGGNLKLSPQVEQLFGGLAGPEEGGTAGDSVPAAKREYRGKSIRLESPLGVSDLLKDLEVALPFTRTNPRVDLSLHGHPTGRMLLFAANSSDRPQRTDIYFQGGFTFRDMLFQSTFRGEGKIRVEIPEHTVQVWEVGG